MKKLYAIIFICMCSSLFSATAAETAHNHDPIDNFDSDSDSESDFDTEPTEIVSDDEDTPSPPHTPVQRAPGGAPATPFVTPAQGIGRATRHEETPIRRGLFEPLPAFRPTLFDVLAQYPRRIEHP